MFLTLVAGFFFVAITLIWIITIIDRWPSEANKNSRMIREYITGKREEIDPVKIWISIGIWIFCGWYLFH